MSAPVRFLVVVVAGWAAVRAATLGAIPGFTVSYAKQQPLGELPPIAATQFPPIPPIAVQADAAPAPAWPAATAAAVPYYLPYPYPVAAQLAQPPAIPPRPAWHLPSAETADSGGLSTPAMAADWGISALPPLPRQQSRPVPVLVPQAAPAAKLDRIQLTSWAMYRGQPAPGALATGGTLGGSQAGARLTYNFNRWLAASLRTTSPLGASSGMEVAGGVRLTPLRSVPVAITLERRQAVGNGGGRSDFALFAEGGLYRQPLPWSFTLDGYFQAGVVGISSRDLFADAALAVSRPVRGRLSAGFGVWGGYQPGIYRVDAGPRVSVRLRRNIYANIDWRQRLAGSARPASGPALTIAADF